MLEKIRYQLIEKGILTLLGASITILLLLSLCLIAFMNLSFDEAWLFSIYQETHLGEIYDWKLAYWSLTNAGPFVLLNTQLYALFGMKTWIFRLVPFFSLILIIRLLYRWSAKYFQHIQTALIVIAVFLGTYGTIELGAYAHGCIFSMFFFLFGLHLLYKDGANISYKTLLWCGVFFGAAASSRLEFLILFPAVFLDHILDSNQRKKQTLNALIVCFLGGLFFLFFDFLLLYARNASTSGLTVDTVDNIGLQQSWIDYPRVFNKWVIINGYLPLPIMIAATLYAFTDKTRFGGVLSVLAIFGWISICGWILKSPIAHLRYIWPALASFGIITGFGLGAVYEWCKSKEYSAIVCGLLLVILGFPALSGVNAFRSLIHGDGDIISWEWSRESPMTTFRLFRHRKEQQQMAEYLSKQISKDEVLGVIGQDLELEMITGIKIVPLKYYRTTNQWIPEEMPKRLLITPMIGNYLYLKPAYYRWIEENLIKEAEFGHYILYRLVGSYPEDPNSLKVTNTPYPAHPLSRKLF